MSTTVKDRHEPISVSVSEAKRMTGLGQTVIYNLMGEGRLPFVKIGKRRVIMVDDLRALMATNRRTGPGEGEPAEVA